MTDDLQKMKDKLKKSRFVSQTIERPNRQNLRVVYRPDNVFGDRVYLSQVTRTEFEQEEQMDFTPEEIEQIAAFVKKAKRAAPKKVMPKAE